MRIEDLSPAERALWDAFPRGESVDLTTGDQAFDEPGQSGRWSQGRIVRAEVLVALLVGAREAEPGRVAAVRLTGARIVGSLNLGHADVKVPLELTGCAFDEVPHLYWARLHSVQIVRCRLPGLVASGARVDGHLWLENSRVDGGLWLDGARITGILNLSGAHLSNPGSDALLADRLAVDANIYCGSGFVADGAVRLPGASVGGQLIFRGASLRNGGGEALYASRLHVGGNMFCDSGFSVAGEIRLRGARVGGYLSLVGAVLTNPGRTALNGDDMTVDTDVHCSNVTAQGRVSFSGARIGGQLTLRGARLSNPAGSPGYQAGDPGGVALCLERLQAEEVELLPDGPMDGVLELTYAKIGLYHDNPDTWPGRLQLDGFRYENLKPQLDAKRRLEWLRKDTDSYTPQPYDQLAATFQTLGMDKEAREVLLHKQRDRHSQSVIAGAWGWIQDIAVGYGYRPLRALSWLLLLQAFGTIYFAYNRLAIYNPQDMGHDRANWPEFNPFLYTLNQLLPVGNFNQQNLFVAKGLSLWIADILSALGLVLGLTVAAGATRVLSRD